MGKLPISDEEFNRQYEVAVARGQKRLETEPQARAAHYDKKNGRIIIELTNRCVFMFPPNSRKA